ncbi:hypothetical protein RSK20926_13339 [Roseobacter sp. SK209-2-6]|uniref:hypothetical protein n=1 Tax=Roseobacter sp. SK209-2-6 TaxID=388739 RepID=UPI0000F3C645|nr:hypothetical protein [Roseobacter sp. SK209-2-6]EBA18709.1 hypothetical protein RSK20926_13339 [Roseobacter sp. SK209-2-6]
MTFVADAGQPAAAARQGSTLAVTILAVFAVLLLPAATFLADPMIRHDDYPALLGIPDLFYSKTLNEGRWLNYIWHLREVITPAWLNFLVYNLFWAVYLGVLTHFTLGKRSALLLRLFVAILAGLAVPQIMISLWFNTLIPGLFFVALYALLSANLSSKSSRLLLVIFVPVTLTAYTTYPFLLLALCLARSDFQRSWKDLAALLGVFLGSFILGMLLIYLLNYFEHGIFGIVMADWRTPNPAHDLASLLANLSVVSNFFHVFLLGAAFGNPAISLILWMPFLGAILLVARNAPHKAAYGLAALGLGMAMIFAQGVKTGIELPLRTGGFIWTYYAIFLGWLYLELEKQGRKRLGGNLLFALSAFILIIAGVERHISGSWQRYSSDLAVEIGTGAEPVLVTGTYRSLKPAKASQLQSFHAVKFRLEHLTGRKIVVCEYEPQACADLLAKPDLPSSLLAEGQSHVLHRLPGLVVLQLSDTAVMKEKMEPSLQKSDS